MGETTQHIRFYIPAENLTSRSPYAFSNFDFGITALIFLELRTELVHLYTNSLKDMLKRLRLRLMNPQSDMSRLFMLFI